MRSLSDGKSGCCDTLLFCFILYVAVTSFPPSDGHAIDVTLFMCSADKLLTLFIILKLYVENKLYV